MFAHTIKLFAETQNIKQKFIITKTLEIQSVF